MSKFTGFGRKHNKNIWSAVRVREAAVRGGLQGFMEMLESRTLLSAVIRRLLDSPDV